MMGDGFCETCLHQTHSVRTWVYADEPTCPTCGASNPSYDASIIEEEERRERDWQETQR